MAVVGALDAVAAAVLRPVHRRVGGTQDGVEARVGTARGDASTDGGVMRQAFERPAGIGEGMADAFGDNEGDVAGRAGEDDGEFLATIAAEQVARPPRAADRGGEKAPDIVADSV